MWCSGAAVSSTVPNSSSRFEKSASIKPSSSDNAVPRRRHGEDTGSWLRRRSCKILRGSRTIDDVLGVIWRVYDFNPHTCNRDIVLVDSGAAVVLTLWNELGEEFEAEEGSVLAVQLAYICDYYDINLGTCEWTSLEVNPDLLDASDLSLWYKFWGCSDPPDVKKSRSFTYRTGQPLV